jgi:hypothetical protein
MKMWLGAVSSRASRYRAPISEADGEAHSDTAICSCCIDSQPGASANCTADGPKAEGVRHTARATLLLVCLTQNRDEGAECHSTDRGADNGAVSQRISGRGARLGRRIDLNSLGRHGEARHAPNYRWNDRDGSGAPNRRLGENRAWNQSEAEQYCEQR